MKKRGVRTVFLSVTATVVAFFITTILGSTLAKVSWTNAVVAFGQFCWRVLSLSFHVWGYAALLLVLFLAFEIIRTIRKPKPHPLEAYTKDNFDKGTFTWRWSLGVDDFRPYDIEAICPGCLAPLSQPTHMAGFVASTREINARCPECGTQFPYLVPQDIRDIQKAIIGRAKRLMESLK